MSDRPLPITRWLIGGVACATLAIAPAGSGAQALGVDAARLAARARALTDTADRLKRERDAMVAAARDSLRDTVRAGPFIVATDARYVDVVRAGAESVWIRLRPYYGDRRIAAATANAVFVVRADSAHRLVFWQRFPRLSTRVGDRYEGGGEVFERLALTQAGVVELYLVDRVRRYVDASSDRALALWGLVPPVNAELSGNIIANSFMQLQTAGSIPARDCSAGNLAQCVSALGLVTPLEPIDQIFTLSERRAVGRRLFEMRRPYVPRREQMANPCDDDSPDAECERYVHSLPRGAFPPPMGMEARAALVVTALGMGGSGALDRLLADSTAPLMARLTAASGVERDSLLATWRTRTLAAKPQPVAPSPAVVVAALVWGIGLAGVALRLVRVG